ncbi:hypothetical protein LUZ60_006930 [Juncus effusus]|nr:hypothetical protein LUZ60_006930 [Juncus effusus]
MGEKELTDDYDIITLLNITPYDQWICVNPSGPRPSARYKHAAEIIGEKLYVIGGSRNGRYLSDIQVFDLRSLKWSTLSLSSDKQHFESESSQKFPAFAGHSLIKWENKLLIVAGNSKIPSDSVRVCQIDLENHTWSTVQTNGETPIAREGQSVTVIGSKLFMFGGENKKRILLNDLHILDLQTMTWQIAKTKGEAPAPRFDHISTVHSDRYLLIFGGSSQSTCFNDLHLLDLQSMEWSQPETQGAYVAPRGGHAGTKIDDNWYIVGGGDNKSGATETIVLNTSKFVWSVATDLTERHSLASEGLTVCSVTLNDEKLIVAFGGYNGKYNNEISVMRPKPQESARPRTLQSHAAAAAAASVTAAYAIVATQTATQPVPTPDPETAGSGVREEENRELESRLEGIRKEEKRELESRLEGIRKENDGLRERIEGVKNSHSELIKELESVQGQLAAESSRCTKLEAQIFAAQKRLESIDTLKDNLETLKNKISKMQRNVETTAQRQKSGGVWQWVAGSPQDSES